MIWSMFSPDARRYWTPEIESHIEKQLVGAAFFNVDQTHQNSSQVQQKIGQEGTDLLNFADLQHSLISVVEHTGHPDSWWAYMYFARYCPQVLHHHVFVSALDTWKEQWKRNIAESFVGDMMLFDRAPAKAAGEIRRLTKFLNTHSETIPFIYPQAGRNPGGVVEEIIPWLSYQTQRPMFLLQLEGAREVWPKLPSVSKKLGYGLEFIARKLLRQRHQVTVTGLDFISPEGKTLEDLEDEYYASYQLPLPQSVQGRRAGRARKRQPVLVQEKE